MSGNIPQVRLAMAAVSRDCFPAALSKRRASAVAEAYEKRYGELMRTRVLVESEADVPRALEELRAMGANALVIYLGNFGPEGPEALLAERFDGPVMLCAAGEERTEGLRASRGDAYCGLLNASYSLGLRGARAYIPSVPVGTPDKVAEMIHGFEPIARVLLGVRQLKIISFGPRPQDFLACNAPLKPLYDLGLVSVEENSELDLLDAYRGHDGDERIPQLAAEMAQELGQEQTTDILLRLAQYELTLLDWMDKRRGAARYVAFASKCWPAFAGNFGFVPCYVHGRLTARGIPVACEVDLYGALSEYMAACAADRPPLLLDINNTVPPDMYDAAIKGKYPYTPDEVFMAFHCGNGYPGCVVGGKLTHHAILKQGIEPDSPPDKSRGTYEGNVIPGPATLFRLHGAADGRLCAYAAQGEVLPVDASSFGTIGVFGVPEMMRFYRYVLLEKHYPHHCAVAFGKAGRVLFEAVRLLGVEEMDYNRPSGFPYPCENPFE